MKPVGCGTKINPTRTNAQPVPSGLVLVGFILVPHPTGFNSYETCWMWY